ncbi:MAG TPA: copper-binding protein [Polyangiaceae bacterium]|nr:copper-binding protein [Polyangiaceae bacterium]
MSAPARRASRRAFRLARLAFAALAAGPALAALAFAPGCGGGGAAGPSAESAPRRYVARGVVRNVARPEGKPVLLIHHERIASYVGRDGQTKAMPSMAMPFGVGPSVSLEGLEPDAKIEFTFSVDWSRYPPSAVESVRALPAETALSLPDAS